MYFCKKFVAKEGPLHIHSLTTIPMKFFRNKFSPILMGTVMLHGLCTKQSSVGMTCSKYNVKYQITRIIYLL